METEHTEATEDWEEAPSGLLLPADGRKKPLRDKDNGTAFRRGKSIRAYIGSNGGGKSACGVKDLIPSLKAGRTVLSTVALIDPETGEPYPSYVRLTDWDQVLYAKNADLFFDEVIGIASSRTSHGMPVQVANKLNQLRRDDVTLSWTAPSWNRADVIIRECTQAVTHCRGFLPKTMRDGSGTEIKSWRPKRLFRWITYDAQDFTAWTDSKQEKLSSLNKSWFWGPGSEAFETYNTMDAVERVGEVLDTGTCAHCGGAKPRKKCSCDDHKAEHAHAA